ncbi:MAG TPA: GTP-binding protein, partial [Steroidobacteraceae bacterium]
MASKTRAGVTSRTAGSAGAATEITSAASAAQAGAAAASTHVDSGAASVGDATPLRFLTCGSVDDGKSTLIGRLLYDTKLIMEDQLVALERDSRK